MIYNIKSSGNNVILYNEDVTISSPYFLVILTNIWTGETKNAVLTPQGCANNWELNFIGVGEDYEDLTSGEIYFDKLGTWTAAIYEQSGSGNTDPDYATLLTTEKLQVQ